MVVRHRTVQQSNSPNIQHCHPRITKSLNILHVLKLPGQTSLPQNPETPCKTRQSHRQPSISKSRVTRSVETLPSAPGSAPLRVVGLAAAQDVQRVGVGSNWELLYDS